MIREANLEYMCEGCDKADKVGLWCTVYAVPPAVYAHLRCCPFNNDAAFASVEEKKRVGQQKQKKKHRKKKE